jgi:hypothetical protein
VRVACLLPFVSEDSFIPHRFLKRGLLPARRPPTLSLVSSVWPRPLYRGRPVQPQPLHFLSLFLVHARSRLVSVIPQLPAGPISTPGVCFAVEKSCVWTHQLSFAPLLPLANDLSRTPSTQIGWQNPKRLLGCMNRRRAGLLPPLLQKKGRGWIACLGAHVQPAERKATKRGTQLNGCVKEDDGCH